MENKIIEAIKEVLNENKYFIVFLLISVLGYIASDKFDQSRQLSNLDIAIKSSAEYQIDPSDQSPLTLAGKKIASKLLNPWVSKNFVKLGVDKNGHGVLVLQTKDLDASVIEERLMKAILGEGGQSTSLDILELKKLIQELVGKDISIDKFRISPYHQLLVVFYH